MHRALKRLPAVLVAIGIMGVTFGLSIVSSRRPSTPPDPMARWVLPDLGPPREAQTFEQPNIVLVIGCSLRRDVFEAYGGGGVAPHLDRRATQGVVFDDAIASATWTRASVASMLTGEFASATGVVEPEDAISRREFRSGTLLSERLSERGYRTFGATSSSHLNERVHERGLGASRGFDVYVDGPPIVARSKRRKFYGDALIGAAFPRLVPFADARERPAFIQLFVNDAHAPARLPPRAIAPFRREGEGQVQANYRAMVHRFDRTVAVFEEGLAHLGFNTSNTVFIVVGDHGEGLGLLPGHGRHHGTSTRSSIAEVPMQVWGRQVHGGHRVGGVFSLKELPTLVESLTEPGGNAQLDGRSDHTGQARAWVDSWYRVHREVAFYETSRSCRVDFELPEAEVRCVDRHDRPIDASPGDLERIVAFREAREVEQRSTETPPSAPSEPCPRTDCASSGSPGPPMPGVDRCGCE